MTKIGLCPEITVLSSLLDGEITGEEDETIKSHVKNCPACARRLQYMELGDRVLVRDLGNLMTLSNSPGKKDCISAETMTSYLHDLLSDQEKARVEGHLDGCDSCLRELTALAKMEAQLQQSSMEPLPGSLRKKVEALWREEEGKKKPMSHVVGRLVTDSIEFLRDLLPRPSLAFGGVLAAVMAALLLFVWWEPFRVTKESSSPPTLPPMARPPEEHGPGTQTITEGGSQIASAPPSAETESESPMEAGPTFARPSGPVVASRPGDKIEEGKASIPAGRQEPLGETKSGVHLLAERARPPGERGISQDFRDVRVEAGPLQVAGGQAILLLKIFNRTEEDLGIMLAEPPPLLTDKKGAAHRPKTFTGIKPGPYAGRNWTYIAPHGEHTISLTFDERNLSVRRDSVYSISVEIMLAPRDDIGRTKSGSKPARAKTLSIALQGIGTQ